MIQSATRAVWFESSIAGGGTLRDDLHSKKQEQPREVARKLHSPWGPTHVTKDAHMDSILIYLEKAIQGGNSWRTFRAIAPYRFSSKTSGPALVQLVLFSVYESHASGDCRLCAKEHCECRAMGMMWRKADNNTCKVLWQICVVSIRLLWYQSISLTNSTCVMSCMSVWWPVFMLHPTWPTSISLGKWLGFVLVTTWIMHCYGVL